MPIGVNVNNPQEENPVSAPQNSTGGIVFGGNALGSGASTSTSGSPSTFSTILLYGAIALVVIFILRRLEN